MKNTLKTTIVGVLGVGVGFAIGFKHAERQMGARFEERLEEETAGMKEFYTNVKQPYKSPEEAAAALIPQNDAADPRVKSQKVSYNKIVKTEGYIDPLSEFEQTEELIVPVVHANVFDPPSGEPKIITQDEYMLNEPGYEQTSLMFYANGGVLTDLRDDVIENVGDVVGTMFSTNFGHGTSDPNTVHVRNDSLQMDFEICMSDRSYEEDVLGQVESETPNQRVRREG